MDLDVRSTLQSRGLKESRELIIIPRSVSSIKEGNIGTW
jgi:hypothetical protein